MQIGDDKPAAWQQHTEDLPIVGLDIGQIALVHVGHDEIKRAVPKKAQVLYVGRRVAVFARFQFFGRLDHGRAEVQPQHMLRAEVQEHAGKAAFATPAIEHVEAAHVSARLHHRPVQETGADGVASLASFLYPGRRDSPPFFLDVTVAHRFRPFCSHCSKFRIVSGQAVRGFDTVVD